MSIPKSGNVSSNILLNEISSPLQVKSPRVRLEYLDGLRGLAAIYVVLYHLRVLIVNELPHRLFQASLLIGLGRFSVAIFIVLSGYCLMLPVVRSTSGQLQGGTINYLKRRARRILPPYYAAFALSLLLTVMMPTIHNWNQTSTITDFDRSVIFSHLLLVHNLSAIWAQRINAPLWSVATEWQIYFFFPFVLLPVWRRFGVMATITAGFVIGLSAFYIWHLSDLCSPWFLGLFAMGLGGAVINFSDTPQVVLLRDRISWGRIALALSCVFVILILAIGFLHQEETMRQHYRWVLDALIGAATTCCIVYCTRALTEPMTTPPAILRLLESRPAIVLGGFSYSLYLIHSPLLECVYHVIMPRWHLSPTLQFAILLLIVVPLILLLSYLFHMAFERPWMGSGKKAPPKLSQEN